MLETQKLSQLIHCSHDLLPKCFAACRRHDLTEGLKNLQCKTLIFAGESSPFHAESVYMSAKMDSKICALVEVGSPLYTQTASALCQSQLGGKDKQE